jgi:hypothetical protein
MQFVVLAEEPDRPGGTCSGYEVELNLFVPFRVPLSPRKQRRHCGQDRFCPMDLGMTAGTQRQHKLEHRPPRYSMMHDDGSLSRRGVTLSIGSHRVPGLLHAGH